MSRHRSRGSRALFSGALVTALLAGVTAGLIGSTAQSASAAGQARIVVPTGAQLIPDSYIVVLKAAPAGARSIQATTQTARTLTARYGGAVTRTYSSVVNGFAVHASATAARQIAADASVSYVEQDSVVRLNDTTQPNATWGIDRVDQRNLPLSGTYTYQTTASNVHAYVIDTGIFVTHSEFQGRASVAFDSVNDGRNGIDCHGHGTHVAGTIGSRTYGLAKEVKLHAVRVLNCQGSGTNAGVIAGVDWVGNNAQKPAVANMSLGGGASPTLDNAVTGAIGKGVTFALAAGNENQNACNVSPARTPAAITVGATTNTDARASFSNWGTCLDIFAPGQNITSTWNTQGGTNTISGTSMASPHVAGGAALYLGLNPNATPQQVRDGLVNAATSGVVTNPGSGSPNKLLYTLFGGSEPPPPGKYFENPDNVNIPDYGAAVESPITVTGVSGNAPSNLQVGVDIKHTYRGDLVIDLVAPDGSTYRMKNSSGSDSADNVITTYTVNASTETANGTWKLRVQDVYRVDTGYIDKWSLQF